MRTLIKGKESIYSAPLKKENSSQQTPYSKEIVNLIIRIMGETWEGFSK